MAAEVSAAAFANKPVVCSGIRRLRVACRDAVVLALAAAQGASGYLLSAHELMVRQSRADAAAMRGMAALPESEDAADDPGFDPGD